MHGTIASRNSTMNNGPPSGLQQPGGSHSYGRFSLNGIPGVLPQLSHASLHGQSGITNRGGLGVSQILGNSGPQITNSIGNLDGGGHIGGSFNSNGGFAMPGLGTHLNLSGLLRNQNVGLVQQNQSFSIQSEDFPALPRFKGAGSDTDYSVDLHRNEQLRDDAMSSIQSQYSPMVRSGGFNGLGGPYSSLNQQQQHHSSTNGSGASFLHTNSQHIPQLRGSDGLPFSNTSNHSLFRNSGSSTFGLRSVNSSSTASGVGSYDQLTQQYQKLLTQSQHRLQQIPPSSPYRDQDSKSVQAPQSMADQFGLLGLMNVVRASNSSLATLAVGIDLATLGMNLDSPEDVYKQFTSPWSDEPAKQEPAFSVPECYHAKPPPALKQVHFSKFRLETLFYIFYSMPKEEAQLYAANELHSRGWLYHKKHQLWLIRVTNVEPMVKTDSYERGSYICFDPNTWKTIRKDNLIIQYEMLEKRPALPRY